MKTEPNSPANEISKREHFAALAMQATITAINNKETNHLVSLLAKQKGMSMVQLIAEDSVNQADALINALNK